MEAKANFNIEIEYDGHTYEVEGRVFAAAYQSSYNEFEVERIVSITLDEVFDVDLWEENKKLENDGNFEDFVMNEIDKDHLNWWLS